MLKIKRVYTPYQASDGYRILIDRLWPRGLRKENVVIDEWNKVVAPSTKLRQMFHHEASKFEWFKDEYQKELNSNEEAKVFINHVASLLDKGNVTLLYAAKDEQVNHAIVLQEYICKILDCDNNEKHQN